MTAADYKISFPYGAFYSSGRMHRGNDRACPSGTPIVVAGTRIGLVGSTGLSTGPHLHTQAGSDRGCQQTFEPSRLEFKPGEVVNLGVGSEWGNFVTIKVGAQFITYCHLSRIDATMGQIVGDDMYNGKTAKEWYERSVELSKLRDSWRERSKTYEAIVAKIKALLQ